MYVRSQAQWVLLYALRADIIRVPTRFFKWESGRDWGELYFKHFQETLGLGFENDAVPAVNSYEVWIRENCGEGSGASDLEADMSGEESS